MPVNRRTVLAPYAVTREPMLQPDRPSVTETFGAAIRQFNTVGSLMARLNEAEPDEDLIHPRTPPDEETFDPFADIEGTVFEDNPEALIGIESALDKERLRLRIERELADRQTLQDSGLLGFGATFAAGLIDPVVLFPATNAAVKARSLALAGRAVSKSVAGKNLLAAALVTARAGALGETAAQSVLLSTQETRTMGEAAVDVAAATIFSGMLGSAIQLIPEGAKALAHQRIARDFSPAAGGAGRSLDPEDLVPEVRPDGSVTSGAEPKIASALGVEHLLASRFNPLSRIPYLRVLGQSASTTMKRVMLQLGDSSARLVEGLDIGRSIESDIISWDAKLHQLYSSDDQLFVRYRMRTAAMDRLKPGESIDTGAIGDVSFPSVRRNLIRLSDRIRGKDPIRYAYMDFRKEISRAISAGGRHTVPEVERAAKRWSEVLFDPIAEELIAQGRLPKAVLEQGPLGARKYVTRLYNVEKLIAREFEFKEDILKPYLRASLTDEERAAIQETGEAVETVLAREADSIFDNIVGLNAGRVILDPVQGSSASPLKPRALDIGDELLEDFLERDIEVIGERYLRTVVPDVMIRRRFSDLNLTAEKEQITAEYRQARAAATSDSAKRKLARQQRSEIKLLDDLVALLRNTYTGGQADRAIGKPLKILRHINFLAFGGGMMLASIPDIARIVMFNGTNRFFKNGMLPLITSFKNVRLSSQEGKLAAVGLDGVLNRSSRFWYELGDEFATSRLQRGARAASNNFGILNLLVPWNVMMKRWAGTILQTRLIEALDNLRLGREISRRDALDLEFLRLNSDARQRIGAMLAEHGFEGDGPVKWADTRSWQDVEAREAFRAALRFGVDQTIVTPGLLDRPPMMSTELGRTFGQFLSYGMSATNRVMLTALQNPRDLATLNGIALAIALGMGVEWLKSQPKGSKKPPETPEDWIKAGIDRSGVIGIYGDIYNKGKILFGGDALSSRYAARNTLSTLLGPSAGTVESLARGARAVGRRELTESEIRNIRRLLPYNQLFYVRSLFDVAEEQFNEAFNIPKRRRRR